MTYDLDAMSKDQLLDYAEDLGLDVNVRMRKDEVRAAIDDALGEAEEAAAAVDPDAANLGWPHQPGMPPG